MMKLQEFAATAMFVIAIGWVGGCSSDRPCAYNQKSYPKGASFPATDGCNTCTCVRGGQVECTLAGCLGDAGFEPPPDAVAPDTHGGPILDVPAEVPLPSDSVLLDGAAPIDTTAWDAESCGETDAACTPDQDYCQLPTGLTFHAQQEIRVPNSIASCTDRYRLDSNGLLIMRDCWNGYDAEVEHTCLPALPLCGLMDQITVWNIGADLADPDVKAAFASPPYTLFGSAPWPSDAWPIALDVGGSILVGLPCPSSDTGSCRAIPPGLQRLKDDLQALVAAGAAQPACVELLQP